MNTALPKILENTKKLAQNKFHREALASFQGISYADVFTQYGKLLDGVEVVGYSTAGMNTGCYMVMFRLPTGEEIFFHYTERFWSNLQELREMGIDVGETFVSRRRNK